MFFSSKYGFPFFRDTELTVFKNNFQNLDFYREAELTCGTDSTPMDGTACVGGPGTDEQHVIIMMITIMIVMVKIFRMVVIFRVMMIFTMMMMIRCAVCVESSTTCLTHLELMLLTRNRTTDSNLKYMISELLQTIAYQSQVLS